MSRRARGVELWAALRSLGRSGLADLIERAEQVLWDERNGEQSIAIVGAVAQGGR